MSFLDRFKPQPRWKHADPAARAAAVPEIPADPEHRSVIEDLATGDDDVRVRAAAIARLDDVSLLARLARSERDEDLRRGITDRLVAIAIAPAATDADAALALDGLDEPKQLSTIAKSSPHDTVRAAALGRIHDARALGSVARHAEDRQTARGAVGRAGCSRACGDRGARARTGRAPRGDGARRVAAAGAGSDLRASRAGARRGSAGSDRTRARRVGRNARASHGGFA